MELGDLFELGDLASGDAGEALRVDGFHAAAAGNRSGEDFEPAGGEHIVECDQFHAEAHVRLVGTEAVHRLAVGHAQELGFDLDIECVAEGAREQALDQLHDVVALDERGLDVDLGELGLAVSAQVFVAETACDLEILLDAGDLQELFVLLWCLGQCVVLVGAEARGDEEVARALGRALGEDRRLDLEVAGLIEEVAGGFCDTVAHLEVPGHARAPQVEVAVLHAQVFVRQLLVELEGEDVGAVDDLEILGDDLNLSGVDVWVDRGLAVDLWPVGDDTGDLDDVLVAQRVAERRGLGVLLGAEHRLRDALAVADVDEDHAVVVTLGVDPTD